MVVVFDRGCKVSSSRRSHDRRGKSAMKGEEKREGAAAARGETRKGGQKQG